MRTGLNLLVAAALFATTAQASPPPPPPPRPPGAPSPCEAAARLPAPFANAPVTVRSLPVALAFLPGPGFKGSVKIDWQVELTLADPDLRQKVGNIVDMEFSAQYGLLAVTSGGWWLSLDLQGGRLDRSSTVALAPMQGAPGKPTWVSVSAYDQAQVIFADVGIQARYELRQCGAAARAETSPYPKGPDTWTLNGYRFRTASDPDRLIPDLRMGVDDRWALWRPIDGPDHTLLQLRKGNVGGSHSEVVLGRFNLPLAAQATLWDDQGKVVRLWLVREGVEPGVFTLYSVQVGGA